MDIDQDQQTCLEEYSQVTGRTVSECLWEALDDWIKVVARTVSQTEKFNVVQFPEIVH